MSEPNPHYSMSRRARYKEKLTRLLKEYDLDSILKWSQEVRNPLTVLSSMLFSDNRLLCWRIIQVIGQIAATTAKDQTDILHQLVRHNFWMMNDESGNVGWYAPETIGEILYNVPVLIPEFGKMLLSYLIEEPFERGTHWAVGRIAQRQPSIYADNIEEIALSLNNPDAHIRGYTLIALQLISPTAIKPKVRAMTTDKAVFDWYDFNTGQILQDTVGSIAERIIHPTG